MARADLEKLRVIWSHSTLGVQRKIRIFDACVVSKLLYGLQSACFNQAERRRLDGFYARSLRKILRLPPAYYRRVSNDIVLARAREPLSARLLQQQMMYY